MGGEIGGERASLPRKVKDWPAVALQLLDQASLTGVFENRPSQRHVTTDHIF
jgi:hypothetical protein